MRTWVFLATLLAGLLVAHLCHAHVLWTEEGLPLAAAQQMLFGKTLYRDIWFDKPPLVPLVYLLEDARNGFVLRIFGALYIWACCVMAFLLGRAAWNEHTGVWSAGLLGFFLTFDTSSAVLPLAADLLMVLPHLAAVFLAFQKRPLWSGLCAALAFWVNVKGVFVLAACALFAGPGWPWLLIGFVLPNAAGAGTLAVIGAWPGYIDQVWVWPSVYAGSSHVADPFTNGLLRTANWVGFHAALVVGSLFAVFSRRLGKLKAAPLWGLLSLAGVAMGARFFPRYFFQLLPAMVLMGACGLAALQGWKRCAALALLVIPLARFGPRYPIQALNLQPAWPDLSMDRDSRSAANRILQTAQPNDTLYVWGYRPDLFVYTGLPAASRYLDSQAMTGVPADRHLTQSQPVAVATTAAARSELARSRPSFIADGLSMYNPRLAMQQYPELRPWLAGYQEFARTGGTILYRRTLR